MDCPRGIVCLNHKMRLAGMALLLMAVSPRLSPAQPEFSGLPEAGVPAFDLDWAAFRQGNDSIRLEIYYRITNPHLSYVRRTRRPSDTLSAPTRPDTAAAKETFVASYEMTAILSAGQEKQVAAANARENYALGSFEETRNPSGYLVNILTMTVRPGDFDLAVTLTDRISGNSHVNKRPIALSGAGGRNWVIGGPEFFDPAAEPPDLPRFRRAGVGLVPNVARSSSGLTDRLAIYLEVYGQTHPEATRLLVEADQRLGRHHLTDTVNLDRRGQMAPIIYRNPLTGFGTGDTRLRLTVIDSLGHGVGDPVEAAFWIDWSLSGLVAENWEEAVDMLAHIASHNELKTLRSIPEAGREAALAAFWKSKDPTPETPENEWEEEYYRRIRYADLHFSSSLRRGWRTDFGGVYIKYGEPDEVDRHPFDRGDKPYEIWYYYSQRRRFVFVDAKGNGEFELEYPYDGVIR